MKTTTVDENKNTDEPAAAASEKISQGSLTPNKSSQGSLTPNIRRDHTQRHDRRVSWEWNYPLLVKSTVLLLVFGAGFGGIYWWQSSRLADQLLGKANAAKAAGDRDEEVRWLTRYVGLHPDDTDAMIELALAVDASVVTSADLNNARKRLSAALSSCGEESAYDEQRKMLREKLIRRLLQLGPWWATEAERQVLALKATPGDPQVTKWLAEALAAQREGTKFQLRDPEVFDRETEYWQWLASQPTGEVLHLALEANPQDADLGSQFISACLDKLEWFDAPGRQADPAQVSYLADTAADRLKAMLDDGQAQLAVFAYEQKSHPAKAKEVLKDALEPALERLAKNLPAKDSDESTSASASPGETLEALADQGVAPLLDDDDYQAYWDWQIALETANSFGIDERDRAIQIYKQLLELDADSIGQPQVETVYVNYGTLMMSTGGIEQATQIWSLGIKQVPESLNLLRRLAMAYIVSNRNGRARETIEAFGDLIESQRQMLEGSVGAGMLSSVKQSIEARLDKATWEHGMLRARLEFVEGDVVLASRLAREAFQSTLVLPDDARVEAGRLLAECYSKRQLWDMSGEVLDKCISISPNDSALRQAAANFWRNAGSLSRATQQLEAIDDGSFSAALEIAELAAYEANAASEEQVDRGAVLEALAEARRRYESAPPKEQAEMAEWRLQLLELGNAARDPAQPLSSEELLTRLEEIAAAYPDIADVQLFAAQNLARNQETAKAKAIITQLQRIATRSGRETDAAKVAIALASLDLADNDVDSALAKIRAAMKSYPTQQSKLAELGSEIAISSQRLEDAYTLLASLSPESQTTTTLMELADLAIALEGNSESEIDMQEDLDRWVELLRTIEGEQGTHWRYVRARQLLAEATKSIANRSRLIDQANRLFIEIDGLRPRWGRSAALGGQIASLRGYSEDAIRLLRRARRNGDRQLSSVMLLVKELFATNRLEQAEQEMQSIGPVPLSILSPLSSMTVAIARKQGDIAKAILVARQLTVRQPEDVSGWLLLSQTLLASSRTLASSAEYSSLMEESWSALLKATEVTSGKNATVWDARFRFQLENYGREAAERELQLLELSQLPPMERFLASGGGYMKLGKYEKARERLDQAVSLDPRAVEPHLALSELHTLLGDSESSIAALRRAHALDKDNLGVRERLALRLAFGDAEMSREESEANLREIRELLAGTDASASYRSRLIGAWIDLFKGNREDQRQAELTLREISQTPTSEATNAKRSLAMHYVRLWLEEKSVPNSAVAIQRFNDASGMYEQLLLVTPIEPTDVVRYFSLLLASSEAELAAGRSDVSESRLNKAEQIVQKLESTVGTSSISLQLRLRLAMQRGNTSDVGAIAAQWVQDSKSPTSSDSQRAWELAGVTLNVMGFSEEAIVWLEKLYEQDPSKYAAFAFALAKAKKYDRAVAICAKEYASTPSVAAAAMIPEIWLMQGGSALPEKIEQLLGDAFSKFGDSTQFLESLATLRLIQERYPDAVALLRRAEEIEPNSVRTLNNLAMVLSELPMSRAEALTKIDRAIELDPRNPELLDTKGVVLFRNGQLDKAEAALRKAIGILDDPRFQLHLAQVAVAKQDDETAKAAWERIDPLKLDAAVLSADERDFMKQLDTRFHREL